MASSVTIQVRVPGARLYHSGKGGCPPLLPCCQYHLRRAPTERFFQVRYTISHGPILIHRWGSRTICVKSDGKRHGRNRRHLMLSSNSVSKGRGHEDATLNTSHCTMDRLSSNENMVQHETNSANPHAHAPRNRIHAECIVHDRLHLRLYSVSLIVHTTHTHSPPNIVQHGTHRLQGLPGMSEAPECTLLQLIAAISQTACLKAGKVHKSCAVHMYIANHDPKGPTHGMNASAETSPQIAYSTQRPPRVLTNRAYLGSIAVFSSGLKWSS